MRFAYPSFIYMSRPFAARIQLAAYPVIPCKILKSSNNNTT